MLSLQTKTFANYYWLAVKKPAGAFTQLLLDSKALKFSGLAVAITAILYTGVYYFLILGGGQPFHPWLNIPLETYYRYNVFFCAPSMFLGWILAAGVVHVMVRTFSKAGTFEQILIVFGFGISIASWSTGIHDIFTSFLGSIHVINQREYEVMLNSPTIWRAILWMLMIIYLIWFILLFSVGVRQVYHLTMVKSLMTGILGFVVYQSFFLIFNR